MIHRVLIREGLHHELADHLLSRLQGEDAQEEVCFALWYPGDGVHRYTGILGEVILPAYDDRNLHGNVTVQGAYLNRVLDRALAENAGVAVLHSHPACGWQALSLDDDDTERNVILPFVRETGLPLLGFTLAENEIWSARFWHEPRPGEVRLAHCIDVRRVGTRTSSADSPPSAYPSYTRRTILKRTVDSWGLPTQARLARIHVCVIGAGSVGALVLESLARTGFEHITIIDHDEVALHNLDRLAYADRFSVGLRKADLAAARVRQIATASRPVVHALALSIRTERAYCIAADADLIVSCVDNAEARDVVNHLAYSNCLPLIDGGVLVDSTEDRLLSAKWRVHLVGPDMRCLRCRGQYTSSEAADERQGLRRHGRYIDRDEQSGPEPGQNTFAFCNLVAAEEIRLLLRYLVGEVWWHDTDPTFGLWAFEHRFVDAHTKPFEHPSVCFSSCEFSHKRLGLGKLGRPSYPFLPEPHDHWSAPLRRRFWRLRRMVQRSSAFHMIFLNPTTEPTTGRRKDKFHDGNYRK